MSSFVEKLTPEGLAFFNEVCQKPFAEQAVSFLNAYWEEVGSQADFIFSCAYEVIKAADMHAKGVEYVHKYVEGNELEFNIGLYFYELLCKTLNGDKLFGKEDLKSFSGDAFKMSQPEMMTSLKRKSELRDKVDVNFDGKIGFLEYLLYQYKDVANPADFVTRSMNVADEHPLLTAARNALEEVNKRIREYEAEKARLEELAAGTGVKALRAKNQLAQLESGPLKEELNKALITAEAAVRIVTKKLKAGGLEAGGEGGAAAAPTAGAIWWMNKDLDTKKKKYGR